MLTVLWQTALSWTGRMSSTHRVALVVKNSITDSMDMSLAKLWEMVKEGKPGMLQSMGSQRVEHD